MAAVHAIGTTPPAGRVAPTVADAQNLEQAIDRPVNVRKDHQKGDTMIGVPMRSFDEELQPSEYLLRSKVP